MKNITLIYLIILITISCRTAKERTTQQSYESEQAYAHRQHKYTEAFGWMDSSDRYWTFSSDSVFYYHPDSGLRANQGLLSLWENKVQRQAWTSVMDSSSTEAVIQERHSLWKTYYRSIKDSKWVILIGFLLFGIAVYIFFKKYRF